MTTQMTTTGRTMAWTSRCRCGHGEGAHIWAGELSDCRAPGCRCLVYLRVTRSEAEQRDMDAQMEILRRYEEHPYASDARMEG